MVGLMADSFPSIRPSNPAVVGTALREAYLFRANGEAHSLPHLNELNPWDDQGSKRGSDHRVALPKLFDLALDQITPAQELGDKARCRLSTRLTRRTKLP